jgi:hypothetical protein
VSLVGVTLKEKGRGGREYKVVGEDQGGYVVAPVEFDGSPNERVTTSDLAMRFGTEAEEPQQVAERAGWFALAAANEQAVDRMARRDFGPATDTPEEHFERIADADADADADAMRLGHRG